MQVIDKINQGRLGKVYFAARGRDTREWMMKREQLSPRYITALGELPVAGAAKKARSVLRSSKRANTDGLEYGP